MVRGELLVELVGGTGAVDNFASGMATLVDLDETQEGIARHVRTPLFNQTHHGEVSSPRCRTC